MSLNKIAICMPIYKRPEITNFVLNYYTQLKTQLKDELELILICCGSEGDASRSIAEKNKFIYIEYPNQPLSQKQNAIYKKAKEYQPDACLKIDSDSIVSIEFFKYYNRLINEGYDYAGILDIYFLVHKKICYWSGYEGEKKGETVGVGRFMSKKLLEFLDWRPWGNLELKKGLDGNLSKRVYQFKDQLKMTKTSCTEVDGLCMDIKSDVGITNLKAFSFDYITDLKLLHDRNIDISTIQHKLVKYTLNKMRK